MLHYYNHKNHYNHKKSDCFLLVAGEGKKTIGCLALFQLTKILLYNIHHQRGISLKEDEDN